MKLNLRMVVLPAVVLAALGFGAGLPAAGSVPEFAVPFATVQATALNRALAVWPDAQSGPVVPYQDVDGATSAYMFHFRVDGQPFPAGHNVAAREAQEDMDRFADEGGAPPTGKFRYAHVLVSARYDRAPVLRWGEGLSEFFMTGPRMQQVAAGELGTPAPELERIILTWPLVWYEFTGAGRAMVIHSHLAGRREASAAFFSRERAATRAAAAEARARFAARGGNWDEHVRARRAKSAAEWRAAGESNLNTLAQVFVGGYQNAPYYDWSFGCTPTSASMIFGWLDKVQNFARFVDFQTQRWDPPEQEVDYNVPNVQRELGWSMGTDSMVGGGTPWDNIVPGLNAVVRANSYNITFETFDDFNGENDYRWAQAVAAVNAGQAFLYSIDPPGSNNAHTTAAFGYDNVALAYWVHTTWSGTGEWWHYSSGGTLEYTRIDVVQPLVVAPGPNIDLTMPDGDWHYNANGQGELWRAWERDYVRWNAPTQDSAKVYFSTNGGRTWAYAGKETFYSSFGVDVVPSMVSESARYRVELYCHDQAGGVYLAGGDGSHGNFKIRNEAPPVPTGMFPGNNAVHNGRLPVKPTQFVHRISYADSYSFVFYNDSEGTFQSGWIAETSYRSPVVIPVGSTGWWRCQARNPTGTSNWTINAAYKVVPGYTVHKKYPMRRKKSPRHGGAVAHKKKKPKKYAAVAAEDDYMFMMTGSNTLDFQRYSTWNDTWAFACSVPAGERRKKVKTGAYLVADEDYAYAFKGGGTNEFYRYDPARDTWSTLAQPTFIKGLKGGFAALVYLDSAEYIIAGSGASNNEWLVYDVGRGAWQAGVPATLPVEKAKIGSCFTTDTLDRLWFLQGGSSENAFFMLDLRNPGAGWVRKAGLPLIAQIKKKKVREGGCIEYFEGKIYAVKGGNTREFWRYELDRDTWSYLCEIGDGSAVQPTKGVSCGRSLTASDDGIYILMGNNTDEFFFFCGEPGETLAARVPGAQAAGFGPATVSDLQVRPSLVRDAATITYTLPVPGAVSLKLYDITGKLVKILAQGWQDAGRHVLLVGHWDLVIGHSRAPRGLYLLRLQTGAGAATCKLTFE